MKEKNVRIKEIEIEIERRCNKRNKEKENIIK